MGSPRSRHHPGQLPTGELAVECWCRLAVVYVAPADIKAGRTDTCGAPGCAPTPHP